MFARVGVNRKMSMKLYNNDEDSLRVRNSEYTMRTSRWNSKGLMFQSKC
jgi:hypothetical protein